ncbi:MAG: hypothetical protein ACYS8Y_09155, partial [Planctomycetota bacterium]
GLHRLRGFFVLTGIWLSGTFLPKGVLHPGAETIHDSRTTRDEFNWRELLPRQHAFGIADLVAT